MENTNDSKFIGFGNPESWDFFKTHYPLFIERFPNLRRLLDAAFLRTATTSEPLDKVIFFMGRLALEDFLEILLLVGNGYGVAGLKILRGMYERVVTSIYLESNPGELDRFLDFYWVQQRKINQAMIRSFGENAVPEEHAKLVEENFKRVRDSFTVTVCKDCGRKDIDYRWSKLDFVSMAQSVGGTEKLVAQGYYLPMREAHSTTGAILSRLSLAADEVLTFEGGSQNSQGEIALITAHNLLLLACEQQRNFFSLDLLASPIQTCVDDFVDIWGDKSQTIRSK